MIIREFEEQVRKNTKKYAVIADDRQLTYNELNQEANRVAHCILRNSSSKEQMNKPKVAALLFDHSASMIIGVIAALKVEHIYVPLDINYPEKRLIYMLENSEVTLLLTNNKNIKLAQTLVSKMNPNPIIINIDALAPVDIKQNDNLAHKYSGERIAYILYTSGSTGNPKGVIQNHENVLYYIRNWIQRFSINSNDRMTLFSAFSHDGAGQDMFAALLSGATLYPYNILNRATISGLKEWLEKEKITIWHSVPTLYRYFIHTLKQQETTNLLLPHLRFILLGGEQIRQHDLEMFRQFFPQSQLANVYGQTESSVSTIWTIRAEENMHRVLLGEPLDKTKIFLKDTDGDIVEDIGTGEIFVSSPHLALGYWKNDENTTAVFLHDYQMGPVYKTGDLGRLLGDGTIEFMGRKDTQLKIRGFRVEIAEIENRLLNFEGIKETTVIARQDEKDDTQVNLCAYIVPEQSLLKSGEEVVFPISTLRSFLAKEVPEYMIPSYFIEMASLPVTPSGKIDRKSLPAPEPMRPKLEVTYAAPQTSLEKTVSSIWKEILNLDKIGIDDNFFDLGGNSFDILKIVSHLNEVTQIKIPVVSIFRYPTVRLLSQFLEHEQSGAQDSVETSEWYKRRKKNHAQSSIKPLDIAVIGMAGRFPGSNNIEEFWDNLKNGRETIVFFNNDELTNRIYENSNSENGSYINANSIINDIERFDAAFFNYSPKEAELMDPQLRILHESTWEALENAGYNPDTYEGLIGLYAGNSPNQYWITLAYLNQGYSAETLFLNNNYSTKVSYKLNLQGPSIIVQTACSTSLMAIHLACQGIMNNECNIALAGGVSLSLPSKAGYLYSEGMILSPDGHCRAFADNAGGTIFGDGIGIVVLKRKDEAIADGDTISAIIKATAANNDGKRKVGVTAPSVEGQAEVIRAAIELARVKPDQIGYIETHGTGTLLGDTVEIEALKLAFNSSQVGNCALGSVKTNIGHLNSAAGVAGFIKTVLILKHRLIPATLHFEKPNQQIDFSGTPFYINNQLKKWEKGQFPLRAGVSSFGLGGTNVHAILEELPQEEVNPHDDKSKSQLIILSAKTQTALEQTTKNLINHINDNPNLNLADIAHTLQVGRKSFKHRKLLVCSTSNEISEILNTKSYSVKEEKRPIIFMFPGIGSQYINMGRELYETIPFIHKEMELCFEMVKTLSGISVKDIMFPNTNSSNQEEQSASDPSIPSENINIYQTENAQLALFTIEYALAKFLIAAGIEPYAMIGYSFGEYTAACISGVLTLEDTIKIITLRGRLLQEQPPGMMLSVPATVDKVKPILETFENLAIAIDNGTSCIVSGTREEIALFEQKLKEERYICIPVNTNHALHSPLLSPILKKFKQEVKNFNLQKPKVPYISNITGSWFGEEETTDPDYWATHLSQMVQFNKGMMELSNIPGSIFIEVGPGRDLTALIRRHLEEKPDLDVMDLIVLPHKEAKERSTFLQRLGRLWSFGIPIKWSPLYEGEKRHRIPLPSYPFERDYFWLEGNPLNIGEINTNNKEAIHKEANIADWFYVPTWKPVSLPSTQLETVGKTKNLIHWLLFIDSIGIGLELQKKLENQGHHVTIVKYGEQWFYNGVNEFTIRPSYSEDYDRLINECKIQEEETLQIIHLWNLTQFTDQAKPVSEDQLEKNQDIGYYSILNLAQTIGRMDYWEKIRIIVITSGMQGIRGDDLHSPYKATILGAIKVIPKEFKKIQCKSIDIEYPSSETTTEETINTIYNELFTEILTQEIIYRAQQRWEKSFERRALYRTGREDVRLKKEGVYLITGGMGGMGLEIAGQLARMKKARLVLISKTKIPSRKQWPSILKSSTMNAEILYKIKKIKELESHGAKVLPIDADVSDIHQMQKAVIQTLKKWGTINGVIHAAGVTDGTLIQRRTKDTCQQVMNPKIRGTFVLEEVLKDLPLEFLILFSSLGAITAMPGQVAYCAANIFLDHYARYKAARDGNRTISINWDMWQIVGMAPKMVNEGEQDKLKKAILPREGIDVFLRILSGEGLHQVIVSTMSIESRIKRIQKITDELHNVHSKIPQELSPLHKHNRPELSTPYIAPKTEIEKKLAEIWQDLLRINLVGISDDFFELGGDSLKAITFSGKIHQALNIEIPISLFFNNPTIRELANHIEENKNTHLFLSIPPVEKKQYYDLSSAQKRLFILQRMEPESIGYNLTSAISLEGDLEIEHLETVTWNLIFRHEILRTSFHLLNNKPVQIVHDKVKFKIETHELTNPVEQENNMGMIPQNMIDSFIRPFELEKAPLMRVGLINVEKKRTILILNMHHIVYDGESIQLFIKEFTTLYGKGVLSPLKIHYKDYTEWQKNHLNRETFQQQENYWLKEFSGEVPVLDLSLDFPRPDVQKFEGNTRMFPLSLNESQQLRNTAKNNGITLFMLLLGIINIMLMKLSNQEDIIIGTPVTGRERPELEHIIGIFVSTIALRNKPRHELSLREFLGQVKQNTLTAFENQSYPFEDLVEKIEARRDTGRNPIFDIMLIMHNYDVADEGMDEVEINGTTFTKYNINPNISRFDITFNAIEKNQTVILTTEYCTKLFKEETIIRYTKYIREIISTLPKIIDTKLGDINIIPTEEKENLLYTLNRTQKTITTNKSYHHLFTEKANRYPHQVAIIGPDYNVSQFNEKRNSPEYLNTIYLTYSELNNRANQLANMLKHKGVKPKTIIGLLTKRSIDMIASLLAILKIGAAYLPLDPEYPEQRIQYILNQSNTNTLLRDNNYTEIKIDIPTILTIEENLQYSNSFDSNRDNPELAYVIYTSGSTGNPKGVMVSHLNIINFITAMHSIIPFKSDKSILAVTTISFDIFFLETLLPLTVGMQTVLASEGEQKDPSLLENKLQKYQINAVQFTPSRLQLLFDLRNNLDGLLGVEILMIGGEAFSAQLLKKTQQFFSGKIYNMYGPTETTIWSMVKELTLTPSTEITIGNPIANTQLYIVDRNLQLLPLGVIGELLIGGKGVSTGYLNNIELTDEKFITPLWIEKPFSPKLVNTSTNCYAYRTGDLGRWNSRTEIDFFGRMDHQVKIRGYRIELEEIEELLIRDQNIKEAIVLVHPSPTGENQLCAYIVINQKDSSKTPDILLLRKMLADKLPQYMIPANFVVLEKIPLTPNGKINRKALPVPDPSQNFTKNTETFIAPNSDNEKIIANIWKEILNLEEIGIYDNFFDLGGNSLQVIQLNWKLNEVFGEEIPIEILFRNLSIDFINKYLSQKQNTDDNKEEMKIKQSNELDSAHETLKNTINKLSGE